MRVFTAASESRSWFFNLSSVVARVTADGLAASGLEVGGFATAGDEDASGGEVRGMLGKDAFGFAGLGVQGGGPNANSCKSAKYPSSAIMSLKLDIVRKMQSRMR